MNALDNVERIESGPHDKTAGSSYREAQALADALRSHRRAFDVCDMAEEVDETIVHLAKKGNAELLGTLLIARMNATVQRRAERQERVS